MMYTGDELYQPVKAVIFDLDGTIAYTVEDLRIAMNCAMRHFGWREQTVADIFKAINYGGRRFVRNCMPPEPAEDDELAERAYNVYYGYYEEHPIVNTVLYDGIAELIDALRAKNMIIGLSTNKEIGIACRITDKLAYGKFDIRVGDGTEKDGVKCPNKPDPSTTLMLCSEFGISPQNVLFVGDSIVDMKTAHNAGMRKIWVSWGYSVREMITDEFAPDFTADKPSDILSFVEKCRTK